ncbi:MAG: M48 family metallopeptidase [Maricaulaceae bacterium]
MTDEVLGEFFLAGSGRSVLVQFTVDPDTDEFVIVADGEEYSGPLSVLNIEPPLGSQPRKIYLPEGHLFQTDEREAIADMLPKTGWGFLSTIEKFGVHLLPIAIATPFVAYGVYRLMMPLLVNMALGLTPTAMVHQMDKSTMATLDKFFTDESDLPEETQIRLTNVFDELVSAGAGERQARPPKYRLLFRGGKMGPNAFALPGGTVVITDDLVEMFPDNEDALAGVLGHEIGHVEMEHSLRRIYRAVGIATMVTLMAGDAGPMVEDILLEGSALLSLSFSRKQETESDNFAVDLMHDIGRDPEAMASFFEKIETYSPFDGDKDDRPFCDDEALIEGDDPIVTPEGEGEAADKDCQVKIDSVLTEDTAEPATSDAPKANTEWISTHPLSQKRIDNIRERAAELRGE